METKALAIDSLELKFSGEDMQFSGYASVFGGTDSYGDTIHPKAYEKTLQERDRPIRMRWNHYGPIIGKWLQVFSDEKGLFVSGELTPGHRTAVDVYASMKHGAVGGMSIGYYPVKFKQLDDGRRMLEEIKLIEISVVEEPADLGAQITGIKSAIEEASTIREIECALRDLAGVPRESACVLVARMKSLLRGELAAEEKAKAEMLALFQKQNLPIQL